MLQYIYDDCVKCDDHSCTCTDKPECYDGAMDTPRDSENAQDLKDGSMWRRYIGGCRKFEHYARYAFGCLKAIEGTMDLSPVANQDPVFYPFHSQSFIMWDMALM